MRRSAPIALRVAERSEAARRGSLRVPNQIDGQSKRPLSAFTKLCTPVAKTGDPRFLAGPDKGLPFELLAATVTNPGGHLVCYMAKPASVAIEQNGCGPAFPGDGGVQIEPPQPLHMPVSGHLATQLGALRFTTTTEGNCVSRVCSRHRDALAIQCGWLVIARCFPVGTSGRALTEAISACLEKLYYGLAVVSVRVGWYFNQKYVFTYPEQANWLHFTLQLFDTPAGGSVARLWRGLRDCGSARDEAGDDAGGNARNARVRRRPATPCGRLERRQWRTQTRRTDGDGA